MAAPKVSVVVPYLRAEATIGRAIESVLAQTVQDFEIVAVGDGSTDGTRALIDRYAGADARFRSIGYERNRGPSFARNRGIEEATGEWIAVLDADDWFAPDRLERLLQCADGAPVVVDNMMGIDPYDSTETGPLFPPFPPVLDVAGVASATVVGSRFDYGYLKPFYRRSFVCENRIAYREELRTAEDLVFLLECCARAGGIRTCDDALYFYNLQVSEKKKRSRGTTHTAPRDKEVAVALEGLRSRSADSLDQRAKATIDARIAGLYERAEVSNFRHAFFRGDYARTAELFVTSPRVRAYFVSTLRRKAGFGAGKP